VRMARWNTAKPHRSKLEMNKRKVRRVHADELNA
jgi:hypothetical protein